MNFYISLETAKKLKEWGCELQSEKYWHIGKVFSFISDDKEPDITMRSIPAYHILEDICCRYASEFFGNNKFSINEPLRARIVHAQEIIRMLQREDFQDAEKYILDNCIFNPKNND